MKTHDIPWNILIGNILYFAHFGCSIIVAAVFPGLTNDKRTFMEICHKPLGTHEQAQIGYRSLFRNTR